MSAMEILARTGHQERVLRLRRQLALRSLAAEGCPQHEMADALRTSQPAVSQQLATARGAHADGSNVPLSLLLEAASPLLVDKAEELGFAELAVFGSVARGEARADSDVDLIAQAGPGATFSSLRKFKDFAADVLGTPVDFVTYGGLPPARRDEVHAEAVLLS